MTHIRIQYFRFSPHLHVFILFVFIILCLGCDQTPEYPEHVENEKRAKGIMRTLVMAEDTYKMAYHRYGTLIELRSPDAPLIYFTKEMENAERYSYQLELHDGGKSWHATGKPKPHVPGKIYYYVNHTGIIRFNTSKEASSNDPPLKSQ